MAEEKDFEVVVWGATGFTGRLVAEYLFARYGAGHGLRWAMGGRNESKLRDVRNQLAQEAGTAANDVPLVLADSDDADSLARMAARTAVVCTTVGPYARYGEKLVAECARSGTHYCDLTGETHWMRRMIDHYQDEAARSGARIVHTCGFDSIPSDLGVHFVQRQMQERFGKPATRVKCRVKSFRGTFSGGTVASMLDLLEAVSRDRELRRLLADPYALNPEGERQGPDENDRVTPAYDPAFDSWTGPFVMAAVNTRVVRRSNALLGYPYGKDFRYDEAMLTGAGLAGRARAFAITAGLGAVMAGGAVGPLRRLVARFLPSPGEGPSREAREAGSFDIRLYGETADGESLRARVTGDRDPGYGSTAKMLGESAVCLAQDDLSARGGFWTPASAMGDALLERLQKSAGLDFSVV